MTTKQPLSTPLLVPFKHIHVPEDDNIRLTLPRIREMAADLTLRGQLAPVGVVNGGIGDHPYTLTYGYRRMAAFALLGWQTREVLVVLRKKGDPLSRIADNWAENMQREGVSPLDQAARCHQLLTGTYSVLQGEAAKPIDREVLCDRLGISRNVLAKLLRIHEQVTPEIKKAARETGAPLRLLIRISSIQGVASQRAMLDKWFRVQEELAAEGRKRKKRKKEQSATGSQPEETEEQPAAGSRPDKKRRGGLLVDEQHLGRILQILRAKQNEYPPSPRVEGMIAALRYVMGDLKKLPGIAVEDSP